MNRNLCLAAFLAGLIAVVWVGVGYIGASPLALTMTAIIGAVYAIGALELLRFERATSSLASALAAIPDDLPNLGDWLGQVHPSLRNPVRLRIEGERVGLPGPALTPYLVGLLVMLGMLGTFLGMVVTLNGAVIALESTTDLQTIRAALAAPVKGLGLAFGTSVAGVAASAMLGLMSTLCRRERLRASQLLDTRIATALRGFSLAHQRQETFKALQFQARALPEVVDKLQAMMAQMERQSRQLDERLLANQESFHRDAKDVYADLARSVDKSLKESLSECARLAGQTIQPAVEATMAGIARETSALHARVADTVEKQLDGVSARFGETVAAVSQTWTTSLADHTRTSESLAGGLRESLAAFAQTFEQRSAALLATVGDAQAALREDLAQRDEQRREDLARRDERQREDLARRDEQQREDIARREEQRLAAMTQSLATMASSLEREWQQVGAQTLVRQQSICETLDRTARELTAQTQAHAGETIAQVARLMETAAEAPRAAAEVIGELRRELSNSVARDNALLEERSRIMAALGALLETTSRAATEQRSAIDALVASSTAILDRAGERFVASVDAGSAKIEAVGAQLTGSAVEVASLGEAFGLAVELFAESNDKLIGNLQRIEGSLDKSIARSDEQLAYYVAQAREIIDLSIMSQQRIVEDLQRLAGPRLADEVC